MTNLRNNPRGLGFTARERAVCVVCDETIETGQRIITVKVGDAESVPFHATGRCYAVGIQHGTRPLREDERDA